MSLSKIHATGSAGPFILPSILSHGKDFAESLRKVTRQKLLHRQNYPRVKFAECRLPSAALSKPFAEAIEALPSVSDTQQRARVR